MSRLGNNVIHCILLKIKRIKIKLFTVTKFEEALWLSNCEGLGDDVSSSDPSGTGDGGWGGAI